MKRTTEPQMSPALFRELFELDTVKKGTKIYLANDQKEVHWQHTVFTIKCSCNEGMLCTDANGKLVLVTNEELEKCYVYAGDVKIKEHATPAN